MVTRKSVRMTEAQRRDRSRLMGNLAILLLSAALAVVSLRSLIVSYAPSFAQQEPRNTEASDASASSPSDASADTSSDAKKDAHDQEAEARETFVSTWAERIDAFDAGYPLEGYGRSFAEAAYDYGVDPRYAPAIARVESGSGANCAYACNAWGWGATSWGDWDTAIWEYTAALSTAYGRTLSYEAALSYNELAPDAWYAEVEASMYQIWESESL